MISFLTTTPNVNNNPLPNHGGVSTNLVEIDDDWCVTISIEPIVHDELEKAVASLSIRDQKEFVILTIGKAIA